MNIYAIIVWLILASISGVFWAKCDEFEDFVSSVVITVIIHAIFAPIFGRVLGWW